MALITKKPADLQELWQEIQEEVNALTSCCREVADRPAAAMPPPLGLPLRRCRDAATAHPVAVGLPVSACRCHAADRFAALALPGRRTAPQIAAG
ncbi:hypothetical protein DNH61_15155 [Paenibacillus sambharensis]|uniref:Uncharacterized protein n=1 Tax=Paenibacillus sambharensis TaxID=1803190 RepID=A0A2W1L4K0_9BACL|nr:hypothetical protein DNH61_15155 [Paenibacillus sambharensis]